MQTIGLVAGLSWESSVEYYRIINEQVREKLGGLHSAQIAMYSVDFEPIEEMQHCGKWDEQVEILAGAARAVEAAGAGFFLICSNTMHKIADEVAARVRIPLLHIVRTTASQVLSSGVKTVGLLGTKFTMEESFYRDGLGAAGLETVVPNIEERQMVHEIIYSELCRGVTREESKSTMIKVIAELVDRGSQGIILGCTEIPLLIKQEDVPVPVFDTTRIHAVAAVELALRNHSVT